MTTGYCQLQRLSTAILSKTLDGTLVTGNEHGHFTKGKVAIGASNPDLMEQFIEKDDLVILGNRYESQACAVDIDASCLVVCQNAEVPDELIKKGGGAEYCHHPHAA